MPRLRVAVEATPLFGLVTGVGTFCRGALAALSEREDVVVTAFAVTARRRAWLPPLLPDGVVARQRAMPARPLAKAWSRWHFPPAEWFVGETDVVHGTNFTVPPTRRAARVVTVHDLTTVRFPELCNAATLEYPRLVGRAIEEGAFVHTHSRFVADEIVAHFGADPSRVRAVAPGVPDRQRARPSLPDARLLLGLQPRTERYVLAVGTIEPRKDYSSLVRAFDLLAGDMTDVALVIVGPEGWGAEAVSQAIDEARHRERIFRTGYLAEDALSVVRAGAAVLAYPSKYEGFGFPPLEAMRDGLPVVSTSAGPLPEVLDGAAELVAPGDAAELAAALARVLDDSQLRERLIRAGHERAAMYTWKRFAEGLVGLYRAAASDRRNGRRSRRRSAQRKAAR